MFPGKGNDKDREDDHEQEEKAKRLNAEIERIKRIEKDQQAKSR